ncbi:VOC family protein [Streptomyces cinnabarinus]|uniref:VOC family protein n=1 Tax=Streptomyces cinnabarinus TaxID=67287 RepID=A0ABY7K6F1_9ACTN|nr:VOC family protein [Streptomyces cinnabarinus]WAZ19375.1 VOC family protein [Streptomyces cinnabarinus]
MARNGFTTCLWFDTQAEEAADFYVSVFKNSSIGRTARYPEGSMRPAGTVMTVEFTANGHPFLALNGGPEFKFNEAISLMIYCENQEEIDYYWSKLIEDGGEPGPCGWLKDRYGVSWQVIPDSLDAMTSDPDPAKASRATQAMLGMGKLDIAALQKAHAGE